MRSFELRRAAHLIKRLPGMRVTTGPPPDTTANVLPVHRCLDYGVHVLGTPFPYRGMLAISSDCDGMTVGTFESLHRFLNTREETPWGEGLGLDISDSMWAYVGRQ